MPQVINTNILSLNSQRNLNRTQGALQNSLQRLSSGLRINSAKDDAAGLAISERFSAQIRGLNQAVRNANDAISLSQTAEGALAEYGSNLLRIRELSIQSANASNSSSDRQALNAEAQQLLSEMQRVATQTQFNGQNLLDGAFLSGQFQVGANAGQTISFSIANAQTDSLGSYSFNNTQSPVSGTNLLVGDLSINGVDVGAVGATTASAEDISQAINAVAGQTGVTATASTALTENFGAQVPTGGVALQTGDLVINGTAVGGVAANSADLAAQGSAIADAINAVANTTGVRATSNVTTGAIALSSDTGKTITLTSNNAAAGASRVENTTGLNMVDTNVTNLATNQFTITGTQGTSDVDFTYANIDEDDTMLIGTGANQITLQFDEDASSGGANGDLVGGNIIVTGFTDDNTVASQAIAAINGAAAQAVLEATASGATNNLIVRSTAVGIETAASHTITDVDVGTGISGLLNTAGTGITEGQTMILNGTTYTFTVGDNTGNNIDLAQADGEGQNDLAADIRAKLVSVGSGQTNATIGALAANQFTITSRLFGTAGNSGANSVDLSGTAITNGVAENITATTDGNTATNVTYGTLSLNSSETFQIGGNNPSKAGLATASVSLSAINTIDISSTAGANTAIDLVDGALDQINTIRGDLGAIQNRLESTISNLSTASENFSAARSRILDTDFAAETAALTRAQILQQAGVAMLSQANAQPQTVLALLQ